MGNICGEQEPENTERSAVVTEQDFQYEGGHINPEYKLRSKVYKVRGRNNNKLYTMQHICIGNSHTHSYDTIKKRRKLFAQLQTVVHPQILPIQYQFRLEDERKCGYLLNWHARVSEWVDGETLYEKLCVLKAQGKKMSEYEAIQIFVPILLAIEQVHTQGLLHGNISSNHVFISRRGVQLIAPTLMEVQYEQLNRYVEFYYLEPKLIGKGPYRFKEYNKQSEIYALGMLFLEILCQNKESQNENMNEGQIALTSEDLLAGRHLEILEGRSKNIQQLITSMLKVEPSKRPSIYDILRSVEFKKRLAETDFQRLKFGLVHMQGIQLLL